MIRTERLIIKSFALEDEDAVIRLFIEDEVKKTYMVPDFESRQQAVKLFERMRELSFLRTRYVRGIYLLDNIFIGVVNDVGVEEGKIEVGYALLPEFQGQGYGTEMLTAVIEKLFEKGYKEVLAGAFEENVASRRVMEKAGMHLIELEEEIEYRGKRHRCVYYAKEK